MIRYLHHPEVTTKNYPVLVFIFIVLIFTFSSCKNYMYDLERKINHYAKIDNKLSETERNNLVAFMNEHVMDEPEFESLLATDSAFTAFLQDAIHNPEVEIFVPEIIELPELNKVRFYIETSASMGGYMKGGTDFQDIVNKLIGAVGQSQGNYIRFIPNTITEVITPFDNVSTYKDDLSNDRFKIAGSSPLHKVFEVLIDSSGANDINFFITDGIMSGTSIQITANPKYNIENRTRLMTEITTQFLRVNDTYSVAIFGFYSNFNTVPGNGKYVYYTLSNGKIWKDFDRRPFYVFMFGNKYLVKKMAEGIRDPEYFAPEKELWFGFNQESIEDFVLFKGHEVETQQNCLFRSNKLIECRDDPSGTDPVHFAVGLNLEALPDYAKSLDYLQNNVNVTGGNSITLDFEVNQMSDAVIQELHPSAERPAVLSHGCTHYIDVYITAIFAPEVEIEINLRKVENTWYEDWACENDLDIATNLDKQNKTVFFDFLIDGIKDAYQSIDNANFVSTSVVITN